MQEEILKKVRARKNHEDRLNYLREELHHLILQEIDRKGGFKQLCFVGGTALRILFDLDRFSEDLDFFLSLRVKKEFHLKPLVDSIQKSLEGFGFLCEIRSLKNEKNVQSCFFTFSQLLPKLDSIYRAEQKLAIKLEVDTNPPEGALETTSPVAGERLYKICHYDPPSLFAGKLHALLFRHYTKGRDLYDFLWYVGKKIFPNIGLLENAIFQTKKKRMMLTPESLKTMLQERFEATDWNLAKKDVSSFLSDPGSLNLFSKEIFLDALSRLVIQ